MTATQIIREALEIYARSTLGHDRHVAEQLALQASEMARATFYGADDDSAADSMFPHIVPCDSF